MSEFLFAIVLGVGAGGLYAMLGSGIVAAFKGSGVINFAHGAIAMYAAYTWSELRLTGDIYLPWFDPLPTDTLNVPVRISLRDTPFEETSGFWGQAIPIVVALAMAAFADYLAALERQLESREHLCGDFSLADIATWLCLTFGQTLGVYLGDQSNVEGWYERVSGRPAMQAELASVMGAAAVA